MTTYLVLGETDEPNSDLKAQADKKPRKQLML